MEDQPHSPSAAAPPVLVVRAVCRHCERPTEFRFDCPAAADESASLNPGPQPSRLIDLGQWLSLVSLLQEQAAKADSPAQARRLAAQAGQCIEEALKFYSADNELPATSAFFTEASQRAFAEHPETFARQRLADMRLRLPDDRPAARQTAGAPRPKRWWQFWK